MKPTRARLLATLLVSALGVAACQQDKTSTAGINVSAPPTGNPAGAADPWADRTRDGVLQLKWEDLVPAGGDSQTLYDKVRNKSLLTPDNSDPFSRTVMAVARKISDHAPVVPSLNGRRVHLAGLVVPLEGDGEKMSEFLLVAYYGACIHVPPPPANQIVYVTTGEQKVDEPPLFGSVWVTGILTTTYTSNEVGDAGYTLEAEKVEPYE